MKKTTLLFALFIFLTPAVADASLFESFTQVNDIKAELQEQGITWDIAYTGEYWRNTAGGLKRHDTYLDNLDIVLALDTEKLGLWKGGTLQAYFLSNSGLRKLSGEIIGDLQTVSNIEAPRTARLYELWYEQRFFEEKASILFGLHDFNSEFAVTDYGSLFINSSFGIAPEISQGGRPSIFPLTGPAVRLKYSSTDQWELLFGVYDGNPGDPEINEHLPRSIIAKDQGLFLVMETAYQTKTKLPGTYKFGFWHNTGDFDDVDAVIEPEVPVIREGTSGGYIIVDQLVFMEAPDQGLGAFLQLGGTSRKTSQVDYYIGAGFNYTGLIPSRDKDQAGIAVAVASTTNILSSSEKTDDEEVALELTYRVHICDNFAVQPDVQWIFTPSASPEIDDAIVVGLRFEILI